MNISINADEFVSGLRTRVVQLQSDNKCDLQNVISDCFSDIVTGTPVDTGLAVANWHVTPGEADGSKTSNTDPGKRSTISAGISKIKSIDPTQVSIVLENNADHITALEDGHSGQAPSGMVDVALENVRARLRNGL